MTEPVLLSTLEDVAAQAGATDHTDDAWLISAMDAVTRALERVSGTFLVPRPSSTWYMDGSGCRELAIRRGVSSVSWLGISPWVDQPDDGSGTYTQVSSVWLDPAPVDRELDTDAATRIVLPVGYLFPDARRTVKITGSQGPSAVNPREEQIARHCVVRAFRARSSASSADMAIVGPDGGMRLLNQFAPAELKELRMAYRTPAD